MFNTAPSCSLAETTLLATMWLFSLLQLIMAASWSSPKTVLLVTANTGYSFAKSPPTVLLNPLWPACTLKYIGVRANVFARHAVVCERIFAKRNALESSFWELSNALRIVKIRSQTTKQQAKIKKLQNFLPKLTYQIFFSNFVFVITQRLIEIFQKFKKLWNHCVHSFYDSKICIKILINKKMTLEKKI